MNKNKIKLTSICSIFDIKFISTERIMCHCCPVKIENLKWTDTKSKESYCMNWICNILVNSEVQGLKWNEASKKKKKSSVVFTFAGRD
jgi:hypothetical protein